MILLYRTQNIKESLISKNRKPYIFKEPVYNIIGNYIGPINAILPDAYKEIKTKKVILYKNRIYLILFDENDNTIETYTGKNWYNTIKIIKYTNLFSFFTNVFAWIGGFIGICTAIKEFFS